MGGFGLGQLSTPVPAGLVAWALTDRAGFARWVGYRLLAWWRLVWSTGVTGTRS
ncbi:hypothetical protein [Nonomuraea indica]|uniref:hypothetical protein n=1 Tax=Nonomuraea indica TaxID=1581193 RepID=UPI001FE54247|nr:hypothetical protein [Nonomuraea indica]